MVIKELEYHIYRLATSPSQLSKNKSEDGFFPHSGPLDLCGWEFSRIMKLPFWTRRWAKKAIITVYNTPDEGKHKAVLHSGGIWVNGKEAQLYNRTKQNLYKLLGNPYNATYDVPFSFDLRFTYL